MQEREAYGSRYDAGLPDDGFHWYFEELAVAGVIPTNHRQHCVFVGVPGDRFAATWRAASCALPPRIRHGYARRWARPA